MNKRVSPIWRLLFGLLLTTALSASIAGQIGLTAAFTTWDLPPAAGTFPTGLIVDRSGHSGTSSPAGTVWYGTRNTLVRLIPGNPSQTMPASWTSWDLGTDNTSGLKITRKDIVFVRARTSIQRVDPSTNTRTAWNDGLSSSDLAVDTAGNVWTTIEGAVQRLTPVGPGTASVTRWLVGGGAGSVTLSGVAVNPANNFIYYVEPYSNNIAELNPNATTDNVRRWNLSVVAGQELRQISFENGIVAASTGLDQIISLNVATNELGICVTPTPAPDPLGVVLSNRLVGFTESGSNKIGCLAVQTSPVVIVPSVVTILSTAATLEGSVTKQVPASGTTVPVNSNEITTQTQTACGLIVEAWTPSGCCSPLGIDIDPAGPAGSFYYVANYGGPSNNRISRVVLPLPNNSK
jgi:hypothetical protein